MKRTYFSALSAIIFTAWTPAFAVTPSIVHVFRGGKDGLLPIGKLLHIDGTLYGTTLLGGSSSCEQGDSCGTVFKISPSGAASVLYAFKGGNDGDGPYSLIAWHGALYGTTSLGGGTGCQKLGCGTVFRITLSGVETVLYAFKGGRDGSNPTQIVPQGDALVGITFHGGGTECGADLGCGTVFKLAPDGTETVLHAFQDSHGETEPRALLSIDGTLYGRDANGVFVLMPSGTPRMVHGFTAQSGEYPEGLASFDGKLYVAVSKQNDMGFGTIYQVDPSGGQQVLYAFKGGRDGSNPSSLQTLRGALYGTTSDGGKNDAGTVFQLTRAGVKTILWSVPPGSAWHSFGTELTDVDGKLFGINEEGVFLLKP